METIWKFHLPIRDDFKIKLPAGARILSVGWQGEVDSLALWAAVDPENDEETRQIAIRGTGHPLGEAAQGRFIGTALMGRLVWHVFEILP